MFFRLFLLMLTALSLGAQARGRMGGFRPGPDRPMPVVRERIAARLHEVRTGKLKEHLGLSEDKATAIADRWARFDQETWARRQQMGGLRQQMNGILGGPGTDAEKNGKLQPLVQQLASLRQQQQESRQHFEDDVRGSLTPVQQGRFILLVDQFEKSLQEAIQDRLKERRGE